MGEGELTLRDERVHVMLVDVQQICQYCLIMDALNLGVLLSGAALHPDGFGASFKAIKDVPAALSEGGPEAMLLVGIVLGTPIVAAVMPEPAEPAEQEVVVVVEDEAPAKPAAETPVAKPAAEAPKTRRLVIPKEVNVIPVTADIPSKGPADAPVTIVLFEDFQCPFCSKLAGTMEALAEERPEQLRFAWYDFPMHGDCNSAELSDRAKTMHPYACGAAIAGKCAHEQGKFWDMHDTMFHNSRYLKDRDLMGYAKQNGLDMAKFDMCMNDPATVDKIRANTVVGSEVGVRGTPGFFINGRRFSGAQPIWVIRAAIDAIAADPTDRVLLDIDIEGEVFGDLSGEPTQVTVPGPYGQLTIDAFEATVEGGKAVSKPGVEPARNISWFDAKSACEASGKRLCTEAEWLMACTGAQPIDRDRDGVFSDDPIQGNAHPYGQYPQDAWCAAARAKDDPQPILTGVHPKCATPSGIYDLEGVVKEWVGLDPGRAGVKGGSYYSRGSARCGYFKDSLAPDLEDAATGFRCCQGPLPDGLTADHHPGGKVGDQVMDWQLSDIEGKPLGSADIAGKPTIMTFWASWCQPCRKELPVLSEMYTKYKDQGLVVIGVNVDKVTPKAKAFLRQMPLPFPIAVDADSSLMGRFDARGVPSTFWITSSGTIRQRTIGYDERGKHELEANIQALISAK